ncbi:hypothetical protein BH20GEM2_BH20GEM2_10080 [soil metagenome]
MIDLRLQLVGDADLERLRSLLAREGFGGALPSSRGSGSPDADAAASPERRIEQLERKVLELRNLDVAKTQFLTNVSHELRTPLTALVTYGEILRDGLLGEVNGRQEDALESMIGSCRQLLAMIEEILTYARTNRQAIELHLSDFAVDDVVVDVHRMNASLLEQKRIRYSNFIDGEIPLAHADRDKVAHVLGNLIGNALEFTPAEGEISVSARRAGQEWIEVCVADTGIGVAPEHHEMIFQEFAQVDASRARIHHGTGLGLAIARKFVQLHGGRMWVESDLGDGARFLFTLPSTHHRDAPAAG